ncbi:MAG: restriction endonuclease subunit S [Microcystis sp. M090S1]|jgi:type I restriction enzyme S subunit|uniref:restriction endonuclease subunit S n=1 Tax=Microcystis sp. M090S1 TaxID=2771135 RepID=UPI002583CF24|nr:restriction endonuclease subunit S [Microcystis sp. M090S1]MCA2812419.1 restriction endonuclease subunit S [Microcystis sp. M090S1]
MSKNMIQWLEIGDLDIHISDGNYSSKYPRSEEFIESGVPFIRANNLVNKSISDEEMYFISPQKHGLLKKGHLKTNDVLISTRGDLGKVALVPKRYNDSNINAQLVLLRPNPHKIDPLYLLYCFEGDRVKGQISQLQTGTALKQLPVGNLKRIKIPLPPLEEQRRIAAILDKADGVRRKRKEAIRLTEELLKSTFLEMFGDPVTNPKGWEIAKLGDFGKILTGNTPPRSVSENYGDEIEWIKSDNITTPEHFLTEAEEKLSAKGKKIARTVPNGSVLVTCIAGSRSSIGRAALTDREVAFNQQINAVVPNSDVDPYFLYGQLFVAQHLVQAQSTDSMKGMVNKSKFSSIEFIKPPSQKQQKFGKWFLGFHRYYMNLISGEEQSENLFNSLLQKAFRGEL